MSAAVVGIAASAGGPAALAEDPARAARAAGARPGRPAPGPAIRRGLPRVDGADLGTAAGGARGGRPARGGCRLPGVAGHPPKLGPHCRAVLDEEPAGLHCPSADQLFLSIAANAGRSGIGVVLRGWATTARPACWRSATPAARRSARTAARAPCTGWHGRRSCWTRWRRCCPHGHPGGHPLGRQTAHEMMQRLESWLEAQLGLQLDRDVTQADQLVAEEAAKRDMDVGACAALVSRDDCARRRWWTGSWCRRRRSPAPGAIRRAAGAARRLAGPRDDLERRLLHGRRALHHRDAVGRVGAAELAGGRQRPLDGGAGVGGRRAVRRRAGDGPERPAAAAAPGAGAR